MSSRSPETEIGGPERSAPQTLWTLVLKAKDPTSPERRAALERLIQAYWKLAYFFIRRRGNDVEASKDIEQGLFAALLERNFLQYVKRGHGKFRTFLLTALQHYMADEFDRSQALKRGGGHSIVPLDFAKAESEVAPGSVAGASPEKIYHREWATRVMGEAMQSVRTEFECSGRSAEFEAMKLYLTQARPEGSSYAELGGVLGVSESDVRSRVRALRGPVSRGDLGRDPVLHGWGGGSARGARGSSVRVFMIFLHQGPRNPLLP